MGGGIYSFGKAEPTFLSDLEAPDPVHPVVYSPLVGIKTRCKIEVEKLVTYSTTCSNVIR